VVKDASKKLPSSIREEFINILYQALTKKYKGECFINNTAAIAGVVVAGTLAPAALASAAVFGAEMGAGLGAAWGFILTGGVVSTIASLDDLKNTNATLEAQRVQAGMTSKVAALGKSLGDLGLPLATLGLTTAGTALETTAAGGNAQGSTTIGGIIANDPALLDNVTYVCTKIGVELGTHFYSKKGSCWGNGTGEKLKFKLIEKNKKDPQIIDLNGKNDGIPGANPAASP
jgi:hypothetical protein